MTQNMTPRQLKALAILLEGGTDGEAAAAAGVKRQTVNNWRRDGVFDEAYQEHEAAILPKVTRSLIAASAACVDYLADVVKDDSKSDTVRIRAASTLLQNALRFKETAELAARLDALEQVMK